MGRNTVDDRAKLHVQCAMFGFFVPRKKKKRDNGVQHIESAELLIKHSGEYQTRQVNGCKGCL